MKEVGTVHHRSRYGQNAGFNLYRTILIKHVSNSRESFELDQSPPKRDDEKKGGEHPSGSKIPEEMKHDSFDVRRGLGPISDNKARMGFLE